MASVVRESTLGYHSDSIGSLTGSRNPATGQWQSSSRVEELKSIVERRHHFERNLFSSQVTCNGEMRRDEHLKGGFRVTPIVAP